jgi:F0F1-type ATP synthase membrane subunit b/b'
MDTRVWDLVRKHTEDMKKITAEYEAKLAEARMEARRWQNEAERHERTAFDLKMRLLEAERELRRLKEGNREHEKADQESAGTR